jgi:hypothetical protein
MVSLYDWMAENGYMDSGCDCYDEHYPYPQLCIIPIAEEEDSYDRAVNWILKQVDFVYAGAEPAYDLIGNFEGFVKSHFAEFVEFSKRNKEEYVMADDPEDEDNIFVGLVTVHSLCAGNYCDEDYDDFMRIFAQGVQ